MTWFTELVGSKGDILWWQMSIRAVLVFLFGLVLIRLIGRRAFGQQNPFDIVVSIMIGSNLSRTLTGNSPFLATLASSAVLLGLAWLLEHATARWHWLGAIAKGEPVPLVRDHRLIHRAMRWWGVTENDLAEAARSSGKPGLDAVDDAVLERSGKISTIARG
ncbi:MAG: DUF421 domain-containing protein [Thiohalocapsa sp.]